MNTHILKGIDDDNVELIIIAAVNQTKLMIEDFSKVITGEKDL